MLAWCACRLRLSLSWLHHCKYALALLQPRPLLRRNEAQVYIHTYIVRADQASFEDRIDSPLTMTVTGIETGDPLRCTLESSDYGKRAKDTIALHRGPKNCLKVQFHRTVRVPDVQNGASELPPSIGHFPLFSVAAYAEKLPQAIAAKGGIFFPMYRKWLFCFVGRGSILIFYQSEKRCGSGSNPEASLPSKSTWEA